MNVRNLKLASKKDQENLLAIAKKSKKYHLIILLMLDGGLRVTEVVKLKAKDFDYAGQFINVCSLKKKSKNPIYRQIPMSYDLYRALSNYLDGKVLKPESYIFPGEGNNEYISRVGITKWIRSNTGKALNSHMLRHTFATKVVQTSGIEQAQKLLGHHSRDTTEIYSHIPFETLQNSIRVLDKPNMVERLRRHFYKPKRIDPIGTSVKYSGIIGRNKELRILDEAMEKKINKYVVGPMGVGKSTLLKQLDNERILHLDDMKQINASLKNFLHHLAEEKGKKNIIQMLSGQVFTPNVLSKSSQKRVLDLICGCVDLKEYTIVIDDLTNLTKSGVIVLERLKEKYHMIVAARKIKIDHSTFLSNFERLDIEPLNRDSSMSLIYGMSKNLRGRIEDYEAYRNYVYGQSLGNPMKIVELVERLSKEQYIGYSELETINHVNSKNTVDFSIPIVLMISALMIMRYIKPSLGSDQNAYRLIGGASMIFALFARQIFVYTKRKFV